MKTKLTTRERSDIAVIARELESQLSTAGVEVIAQHAIGFCEEAIKAWEDFDPGLFLGAIGFATSVPIDPHAEPVTEEEELEEFLATIQ